MGWVVKATPRPLYLRERDPVPTVQEDGWAPGPVWTGAENVACTGCYSFSCTLYFIRTKDRDAWKLILKEARVLHGL